MCAACEREKERVCVSETLRERERKWECEKREKERIFTKELLYHFGRWLGFQFRVFECECENTRKNNKWQRRSKREKSNKWISFCVALVHAHCTHTHTSIWVRATPRLERWLCNNVSPFILHSFHRIARRRESICLFSCRVEPLHQLFVAGEQIVNQFVYLWQRRVHRCHGIRSFFRSPIVIRPVPKLSSMLFLLCVEIKKTIGLTRVSWRCEQAHGGYHVLHSRGLYVVLNNV